MKAARRFRDGARPLLGSLGRSARPRPPHRVCMPSPGATHTSARTDYPPRVTGDAQDAAYNRCVNASACEHVARTHGIRLLVQFGSTVTGRVHAKSDVDLAVLLQRPRQTLEERASMIHDLQRLFPDREVDVAFLDHADPLFLKQVMDTARMLHGTAADLRRLQLLAFKRYQDHRKYLDLERRFVAAAVRGVAGRG